MSLSEIVQVTITSETTTVSRAGFGYMMILDAHKRFNERLKWYTTTASMISGDAFTTDHEAYKAAVDHFAQNPRPARFAVGRVQADEELIQIDVVENEDYDFTITDVSVGATNYSIDGTGLTKTQIVDAMFAAINAGAQSAVLTASNDSDDLKIVPDVAGTPWFTTITTTTRMSQKSIGDLEDYDTALAAIILADNDWYGLMSTTRTQAQVEKIMDWVESNQKLFITASADTVIANTVVGSDSTSIAAYAKDQALERSAVMYHTLAATEYADAAWFGKCLPYDAGSINWMFKTLASITVDTLTATQRINIWAKYANCYDTVSGVNITRKGTVGANEFLDIVRGIDWVRSEMQADVYSILVNQKKVPYTNKGIASIEEAVRGVLQRGIDNSFIATIDEITSPDVADVSSADKAARILRDVTFQATVAGAINEVIITGVVSV